MYFLTPSLDFNQAEEDNILDMKEQQDGKILGLNDHAEQTRPTGESHFLSGLLCVREINYSFFEAIVFLYFFGTIV